MKLFSEYLTESSQNYQYLIKLNFKPDNDVLNKIEQALAKYDLVDITTPRSLPILRFDKDFPGDSNPEIYVIDCTVAYPASAEAIRHTIASIGLALQQVAVLNPAYEISRELEDAGIAANTGDKALLDTDYAPQDNKKISDDNFGQSYNDKLVKNSIGSTNQLIPSNLKKIKGKTLNDIPVGKNSPMSKPNKLPKVTSFAR